MATTSLAHTRTYTPEERARMFAVLKDKEAEERYRHELMDAEERLILAERIVRLKKKLAATA